MKIPRLDPNEGTFSIDLWKRFCNRYGEKRSREIVQSLSRPVMDFAVRGTITKISREDVIELFEEAGWKASPHKILSEMLTVKTRGRFTVPFFSDVPRMVLDKVAAESVFIGSDLFVVGIKRMPKINPGDLVSMVSPMDQIVATGISRISSKMVKSKGIAVDNTTSFFETPSLRKIVVIESGIAQSQSIPAAYVGHVLDPKPNDKIIDLCAAPGGKSTSAAILSNNKANIIAFDRSKKRLTRMSELVRNQDLSGIEIVKANSVEYVKQHTIKADKVIVDPSCSAVGVRPKTYDETQNSDIFNVANYQKSFLWAAAKIVRKRGIITYSTCTLEPEENEKVISYAVNNLGLKLVEPDILLGTHGEDTGNGLTLEYMRRFYPDQHDTPGFFVAKLTK
ncbi:MAG: hypothetical protein HZR80_01850 [Candidatus Heimdallarchaeota archaeon]